MKHTTYTDRAKIVAWFKDAKDGTPCEYRSEARTEWTRASKNGDCLETSDGHWCGKFVVTALRFEKPAPETIARKAAELCVTLGCDEDELVAALLSRGMDAFNHPCTTKAHAFGQRVKCQIDGGVVVAVEVTDAIVDAICERIIDSVGDDRDETDDERADEDRIHRDMM